MTASGKDTYTLLKVNYLVNIFKPPMKSRSQQIQSLKGKCLDILVIGGGIHGAASLSALSAMGLSCGLCEAGDFASETSQASSNMIWGGIKYLESLDFALVRELCLSRNKLLRHFPNQVREIRFYAACEKTGPHSPWQLQVGAWIYWLWGNGKTRQPRSLKKKTIQAEERILSSGAWTGGVEYSDAYLPETDARFVFQFISQSWKRGVPAVNYLRALSCQKTGGLWETRVRDLSTSEELSIKSRAVVNAAGPWGEEVARLAGITTQNRLAFSKGVHLIVPRLAGPRRVLSFFSDDGRPFFILPLGDKTCLGTTDTRLSKPSKEVLPEDRTFILENINKRLTLARPLVESDIIAERCGVRPLVIKDQSEEGADWLKLSRKHVVEAADPTFLSILGGKLTDCLNIGDEIRNLVAGLKMKKVSALNNEIWYGEEECPDDFMKEAGRLGLHVPAPDGLGTQAHRLWRRYGGGAREICTMMDNDLSLLDEVVPGSGLLFAEAVYMEKNEMILTLEDFLRRRTLLALTFTKEQLLAAPGIRRVCGMLFGGRADERWDHYVRGAEGPALSKNPAAVPGRERMEKIA